MPGYSPCYPRWRTRQNRPLSYFQTVDRVTESLGNSMCVPTRDECSAHLALTDYYYQLALRRRMAQSLDLVIGATIRTEQS
jgi:hypothetical protein